MERVIIGNRFLQVLRMIVFIDLHYSISSKKPLMNGKTWSQIRWNQRVVFSHGLTLNQKMIWENAYLHTDKRKTRTKASQRANQRFAVRVWFISYIHTQPYTSRSSHHTPHDSSAPVPLFVLFVDFRRFRVGDGGGNFMYPAYFDLFEFRVFVGGLATKSTTSAEQIYDLRCFSCISCDGGLETWSTTLADAGYPTGAALREWYHPKKSRTRNQRGHPQRSYKSEQYPPKIAALHLPSPSKNGCCPSNDRQNRSPASFPPAWSAAENDFSHSSNTFIWVQRPEERVVRLFYFFWRLRQVRPRVWVLSATPIPCIVCGVKLKLISGGVDVSVLFTSRFQLPRLT